MLTWAELRDAVARQTTVRESVVTFVEEVKASLENAKGGEQAEFETLIKDIEANTDALMAAIKANTPEETEPPVDSEPVEA